MAKFLAVLRLTVNPIETLISELPFVSVWKRVYVRDHSYENEFNLQVHFHVNHSFSFIWFRT